MQFSTKSRNTTIQQPVLMNSLQSAVRSVEETERNGDGSHDSGEDRGAWEFDMQETDTVGCG